MAHRDAKVAVPICAVNAIALIKIHDVGDIGQVVTRSSHVCIRIFNINPVRTGYCRVDPGPSRDDKSADQVLSLIS